MNGFETFKCGITIINAMVGMLIMLVFSNIAIGETKDDKPSWVLRLSHPDQGGYRYIVGVATQAESHEVGMVTAWNNALSSIARTQFPFLLQVSESSKESLKSTDYKREATLAIDLVNWDGIEESSDLGSPYFVETETKDKKTVTVYRLLRWKIAEIEMEAKRLRQIGASSQTPTSRYDQVMGHQGSGTGSLTVTTEPSGAQVLLDGEPIGRSNAAFQKVGTGTYQLVLQLDRYETVEKTIQVIAGQKNDVQVKLNRITGKTVITSDPSGAQIYLNNKPIKEVTPATIERPLGEYSIRVEKPGYLSVTKGILIDYREGQEKYALKAKPGRLSVVTTPPKAEVFLDGTKIGVSPVLGKIVDGGDHAVEVKKSGFSTQEQKVFINSIKGLTLNLKLAPEPVNTPLPGSIPTPTSTNYKIPSYKLSIYEREERFSKAKIEGGWAAALIVAAVVTHQQANKSYEKYKATKDPNEAVKYRKSAKQYDDQTASAAGLSVILGLYSLFNVIEAYEKSPYSTAILYQSGDPYYLHQPMFVLSLSRVN